MSKYKSKKIFLAGHNGMVGKSILSKLLAGKYEQILTIDKEKLDLRDQKQVDEFVCENRPDVIIIAAGKVGGILANMNYPVDFLFDNTMIYLNLMNSAKKFNVEKVVFISSSCSYPKNTTQPIKESQLTSGYFEHTNEPLAISKVLGVRLTEYYRRQYGVNYISLMPTNLFGPNDNFDLENSHVLPALMRRIHEAKINNEQEVIVWGSGKPLREFLYVEDFAEAVLFLLDNYDGSEHINVGSGIEVSISDLALKLKKIIDYKGKLIFDISKPDGMLRKVLDLSKVRKLGWKNKTDLNSGLIETYKWFLMNYPNIRGFN
jgi:GDP-L-fucose synthase